MTVVNRANGRVRILTTEENDMDDTLNAAPSGDHRLRNTTDPKKE